jgi:methylenetetrahydrofolate reductase (NADPH)
MKFSQAYGPGKFGLSFELFPPKTPAGEVSLFMHVGVLVRFKPQLITCTYGAGGSTREKTLQIIAQVHEQFGCSVAAHLTCVGSTVDQLTSYLTEAERRGIENIVALRGDPPRGESQFRATEGGLSYASQLVKLIHSEFPSFGIAVAGYPETHREAISAEEDLQHLKDKVDAGADVVITQLFYDDGDFLRFRDRCEAIGIRVPIVPGLLPITNYAQIQRITTLCAAKLPQPLIEALERAGDDAQEQFRIGVDFAILQTQALIDEGIPGIHFYVLNKSEATAQVLSAVRIPYRP